VTLHVTRTAGISRLQGLLPSHASIKKFTSFGCSDSFRYFDRGGYIGAFLTAWVQREGYADVISGLADRTEDIILSLRSKSDKFVHATESVTLGSCKKAENVIAETESSPEHSDQNQSLIAESRAPD
jgi:hypothetical protein